MKHILFFSLSVFANLLIAQVPAMQWERSYGGLGYEQVECIRPTSDGGFIFCGYSSGNGGDVSGSKGGMDFWVVKISTTGSIQWQKPLGGTGTDRAFSINQTSDGGYIAAGSSDSNNGDVTGNKGTSDYWVVKLDNSGNLQWQKTYGGTSSEGARSVIQTSDGGYLLGGITSSTNGDISLNKGGSDNWLVKLNSSGALVWEKTYGGSGNEFLAGVLETSDGAYVMGGVSYSTNGDASTPKGGGDFWLVKVSNTNGAIIWQKAYGGSSGECIWYLQETTDKGFIMAGNTYSNDGDVTNSKGLGDSWIVKADSIGVLQWQNDFGGTQLDLFYSVDQTSDGGFIVSGTSASNDVDVIGNHGPVGMEDMNVVKYNNAGVVQWTKCYGGSTGPDFANSIVQASDGSYIFGGSGQSFDGDVSHAASNGGAWVVKLNSTNSIAKLFDAGNEISVFPNPASGKVNFKCELAGKKQIQITDVLGNFVYEGALNSENSTLDLSDFSKGIYFYSIYENSALLQTGKIIVE